VVKTSDINVQKIAKLANLPISAEEEKVYTDQLSKVLDYVSQLNQVDTSQVEACFNVSTNPNMLREDRVKRCLTQEKALANAPKKKDAVRDGKQGFFVTKGVFEE
jgi:aspartyl-tRNA(Asn)/glutamyl-tRNA(Gln) amidotransferase subunit C